MFPKKIIGKYLGNDISGVMIGKINFVPNTYIECNVNEAMFNQILILCSQGLFYLFEFASVSKVIEITDDLAKNINDSLNVIIDEIVDIEEAATKLSVKVDTKYDNVSLNNGKLSFSSNDVAIKTVLLPVPDDPRLIELEKNDDYIAWRYKPIGKEFIPWENLVSLAEITGPTGPTGERYDDTEVRGLIAGLTTRIDELEGSDAELNK